MGKTFEALERAKKELSENILDVSKEPLDRELEPPTQEAKQGYLEDALEFSKELKEKKVAVSVRFVSDPTAIECCYELKTKLLTKYPDQNMRSILFVGTSPGDGSSTVAVNYATLLSKNSGRMVLLADLNGVNSDAQKDSEPGRDPIYTDDDTGVEKGAFRVKKMGSKNLYCLVFGREHARYDDFFESGRIEHFLEMVYERFDYLVIAAPSALGFSKSRAFCAKVDGIVMVILSGKTRRQIAVKAKEAIEGAGGKLLGVILNRRKYYIPESLYKRL